MYIVKSRFLSVNKTYLDNPNSSKFSKILHNTSQITNRLFYARSRSKFTKSVNQKTETRQSYENFKVPELIKMNQILSFKRSKRNSKQSDKQ